MIQLGELRSGNVIEQGHYGILPLTAYEIYQYSLYLSGNTGVAEYYKHFAPIPLTPDLLQACGFEMEETTQEYSIGDFTIRPIDEAGYVFLNGMDGGKIYKYLHEIQNLFQALYGEELPINLTALQGVKAE